MKTILPPPQALKIFRREHGGVSEARNFGLSQAQGKYVYYLDGDDYLIENTLDGFLRCADNSKADIVVSSTKFIKLDGTCLPLVQPECTRGRGAEVMHAWLECGFFSFGRDKIVSRQYLLDHDLLFLPGAIYEDVAWTVKLYAFDPLVVYPEMCIYVLQERSGSITQRQYHEKYDLYSYRAVYEDMKKFLSSALNVGYVRDVKRIMSGLFFQILSCLKEVQGSITPEERADFLSFLDGEKGIISFSPKPNRRYIYGFIANVFGIGALMKIKK